MFIRKATEMLVPFPVLSRIKIAFRYILSFRYSGNRYECPFCTGRFSVFLPTGYDVPVFKEKQVVGGGYRLNSKCPRCGSGDRERLVYLFLKKNKPYIFSKNIRLLHFAPEQNLSVTLKSNSNIDYVSADLNSPLADIRMDITDINQPENTYDVIICNHVLEHVHDDAKAMRELFRVLKRGGFAILQVPISISAETTIEDSSITTPEEREVSFGQKDHLRIYGRDYRSRLEKAGFSVIEHHFADDMEPQDFRKYGLLRDEDVFLCSKP